MQSRVKSERRICKLISLRNTPFWEDRILANPHLWRHQRQTWQPGAGDWCIATVHWVPNATKQQELRLGLLRHDIHVGQKHLPGEHKVQWRYKNNTITSRPFQDATVLFALQRGIFAPCDCLAVPKTNIDLCRREQHVNTRNQTKKTERNRGS